VSQHHRRPPNAGKGRPLGSQNRATASAREAIALFVDENAPRLQEWLDAIAEGVIEPATEDRPAKVLVAPNPARAFELFQSVVEYHIPKLARTEHTGDGGGPVAVAITHIYEPANPGPEKREP
jgi:hypothetical protein